MVDLTKWTGMLAFAATTGIITAVLNQIFGIGRDLWTTHVKRRSEASYLALRLAALLEGHAYACASFIRDNATLEPSPNEEFPAWNRRLPDVPIFPEEKEGWHSIDPKLAARGLDLRNHLAGSQGLIDDTAEFDEGDLGNELDEQASTRGQEAWSLANDLRRRYRLNAFIPVWDFTETLERTLHRAKKARDDRARSQAEMLAELAADDARADADASSTR